MPETSSGGLSRHVSGTPWGLLTSRSRITTTTATGAKRELFEASFAGERGVTFWSDEPDESGLARAVGMVLMLWMPEAGLMAAVEGLRDEIEFRLENESMQGHITTPLVTRHGVGRVVAALDMPPLVIET